MDTLLAYARKYKSVLLYLVFGALTTLINIVAFAVLRYLGLDEAFYRGVLEGNGLGTLFTRFDFLLSNTIAWILSVAFAYVTNRTWVFESRATGLGSVAREAGLFVFYRLVSLLADTAMMFAMLNFTPLPELVAKVLSNVVVIVLNYVFSKWIIFRARGSDREPAEKI